MAMHLLWNTFTFLACSPKYRYHSQLIETLVKSEVPANLRSSFKSNRAASNASSNDFAPMQCDFIPFIHSQYEIYVFVCDPCSSIFSNKEIPLNILITVHIPPPRSSWNFDGRSSQCYIKEHPVLVHDQYTSVDRAGRSVMFL